jgi:hypothetical protein
MKLRILPLTEDLWPALEDLFRDSPVCSSCWCMYWRIGGVYRRQSPESNQAAFREIVRKGPPPGLLAFDGDLAVGWCQVTPRSSLSKLKAHRDCRASTTHPCGRFRVSIFAKGTADKVSRP